MPKLKRHPELVVISILFFSGMVVYLSNSQADTKFIEIILVATVSGYFGYLNKED